MSDFAIHTFLTAGVLILSGVFTIVGWLMAKKLEAYDQQHQDHYRHAARSDVHWTPRERDELRERLKDMGDDIKELLRRNGGARGKE